MTDENNGISRRSVFQAIGGTAAAGLLPAAAAGQETTATTETATEKNDSVVVQVDDGTRLVGWSFEESTFRLDFGAERPTAIKVTDSGAVMSEWESGGSGGGAVSIPTESFVLSGGKTSVEFAATTFNGAAAVTLATSEGTAFVYSEGVSVGSPAVEYSTVGALTAGTAIGTGYLSFRRSRNKLEESDEPEADRIA